MKSYKIDSYPCFTLDENWTKTMQLVVSGWIFKARQAHFKVLILVTIK